jgi:hypothetical protein
MADTTIPGSSSYQPGCLIPERTRSNDRKALIEVRKCYGSKLKARDTDYNKIRPSRGQTAENKLSREPTKSTIKEYIDDRSRDYTPSTLDLMLLYDQGTWEKPEGFDKDAVQKKGTGVGYPTDENLIVENLQDQAHIDGNRVDIVELRKDFLDIRHKLLRDIPDVDPAGLTLQWSSGRIVETCTLHNKKITRITFVDADINLPNYGGTLSGMKLEEEVDMGYGKPPDYKVENYVAAHMILRLAGKVSS